MMDDFESGDESSTTTLGDDHSIPLLPQIANHTNHLLKDGNSKSPTGGDSGEHSADNLRAAEQMLADRESSTSCANRNGDTALDTPPRKNLSNANMDRMTSDNLSEYGRSNNKADLSNRSPLSPATQTLNELSGMDVEGDNLMYDMSQLSQLPSRCQNSSPINESKSDGSTDLELGPKKSFSVSWKRQRIYLGSFNESEGLKRVKQARDKIAEWNSQNGKLALSPEWIKNKLEALNIRVLSTRSVAFVNKQETVLSKSHTKNICDQVIEKCAATEIVEKPLVGQKNGEENDIHFTKGYSPSQRQTSETYSTHIINLPEKGSFGMNLQSCMAEGSGRIMTLVSKLRAGGQAEKYGVKLDDLIYIAPKGTSDKGTKCSVDCDALEPARIRDILAWANSDSRPVTFVVRRLSKKYHNDKRNGASSEHIHENRDKLKCTTSHNRNKDGAISGRSHQDKGILNSSITRDEVRLALNGKGYPQIPCCRKCKNSNVNNHHYLCPKHQDFEFSGAKDKLTMLFAGMYDGCRACAAEIETGKKSRIPHNKKCEDITNAGSTKSKSRKKNSSMSACEKKIIKQPKQLKTSISKSPDLKGAGRASTKKREPSRGKAPHRGTSRTDKISSQSNFDGVASPIHTTRKENTSKKHQKRKVTCEMVTCEVASKKPTIASNIPANRDGISQASNIPANRNGISQRSMESNHSRLVHVTPAYCSNLKKKKKVKGALQITDDHSMPKWVPCHNPWGSRGHCEGDFILFSPSDYNKSFEINGGFRPKRFVCDPFSSTLSYRKSHVVPQEGLRVLELSRDRLALRSWGFSFCHHDFGGACLVTSIDELSPADAASDLGDSEGFHQGLQVNDLILCINGKKVDGMTVVDLEVELEISNSQILLVVSRCRTLIDIDTHDQYIHPYDSLGELLHWTETGLKVDHSQSESTAYVDSLSMNVVPNSRRLEGLPIAAKAIDDSENQEEVTSQSHSRMLSEKYDSCHAQSFVQDKTSSRLSSSPPSDTEISSSEKIQPPKRFNATDPVKKSTYTSLHIKYLPQDIVPIDRKSLVGQKSNRNCASKYVGIHLKNGKNWKACIMIKGMSISLGVYESEWDAGAMYAWAYSIREGLRAPPPENEETKKSKPAKEMQAKETPAKASVGNQEQMRHETDSTSEVEPEWEDDENPWLGCVCGEIHESPIPVFWIQCDGCDAWFNCAPACIGFDKKKALEKSDWECADCTICDETQYGTGSPNLPVGGKVTPMKSQCDTENHEMSPLPIGSVVNVEARLWPGLNRPGGVGRITDHRMVNDGKVIEYDVRYVLGGTDLGIESKYVSVNATTLAAMDLCSPRSTRSRGSV